MPLYEYKCEYCENVFELRGKMDTRHDPQECPKCGGQSRLAVSANSRQAGQWAEMPYTPKPTAKKAMNKMRG